jgi:hypothetical protein
MDLAVSGATTGPPEVELYWPNRTGTFITNLRVAIPFTSSGESVLLVHDFSRKPEWRLMGGSLDRLRVDFGNEADLLIRLESLRLSTPPG